MLFGSHICRQVGEEAKTRVKQTKTQLPCLPRREALPIILNPRVSAWGREVRSTHTIVVLSQGDVQLPWVLIALSNRGC